MKLIFCKSKNNGLWFINRRQSSDKIITEMIIKEARAKNSMLWVSEYSKKMIDQIGYENTQIIKEDSIFNEDDIVFIEDLSLKPFLDQAKELTIVDWMRDYPATKFFEDDINEFKLSGETKIRGNSHDEIAIRNYIKGENNEEK